MKEIFSIPEVMMAYKFARDMVGNHAPDLIGERKDWEIFKDDIHGKLGEIAVEKYIRENLPHCHIDSGVDYTIMPRGQWDITDMVVNQKYLNVKTVGEYSSYLMVECFRYDEQGNYSYKNHNKQDVKVDGYVLVRVVIKPEIDKDDFTYRNSVNISNFEDLPNINIEDLQNIKDFKRLFKERKDERTIEYEILGAIDHQHFWEFKKYAPKGMKCTRQNLWKVVSGDDSSIEMVEPGDGTPKNNELQTDNFIVHKNKLNSLDTILSKKA